ncbi:MAG: lipid-A-disaccharide synthase [Calditrichaeota bacterium]|nr:lipid-A-disaccharide synthase [Calditrichota bacterium]
MAQKKILLIAGEVSGDQHGAELISALKTFRPDVRVWGIGGNELANTGMEIMFHLERMAFLGVGEVVRHLPFILKVMKTVLQRAKEEKPDCAILIDYPGFNIRMAAKLKKIGVPVVYYISPQLWAWGHRRVEKIRKHVDKMLVLFPFEKEFYRRHGIEAEYVGHPLVDKHFAHLPERFKEVREGKAVLGLLPGSRKNEVKTLLPRMVQTAQILLKERKIQKARILKVRHLSKEFYRPFLEGTESAFELVERPMEEILPELDAALVASGTATLETAYFAVPMVIVYHVTPLTYWLGRLLIKVNHIGLANIVAEKEIAPELIQNDFSAQRAAELLSPMLDPAVNQRIRRQMLIVRDKLGEPGASARAARQIHRFLNEST